MITRNLIRIKVFQVLYALYENEGKSLGTAENELATSLEKAYDLYVMLLHLGVELTNYHNKQVETAYHKFLPTEEERNPNMRVANNRLMQRLSQSHKLAQEVEKRKISFAEDEDLLKTLHGSIIESSYYKTYIYSGEDSFEKDQDFWIKVFLKIILPNPYFNDYLEEKSIYWNDDIDVVGSFVVKTLKKISSEDMEVSLFPKYSDEETEGFARVLLFKSYERREEYDKFIVEVTENWEIERLAFSDRIILQMAIAEILDFPTIPVAVTLNEYIELAKFYSTSRSGIFVNGLLDKIISKLRIEEKIVK